MKWPRRPRWLRKLWPESTPPPDRDARRAQDQAIEKTRAVQPRIREAQRTLDSFTRSVDRAMRGQQP